MKLKSKTNFDSWKILNVEKLGIESFFFIIEIYIVFPTGFTLGVICVPTGSMVHVLASQRKRLRS